MKRNFQRASVLVLAMLITARLQTSGGTNGVILISTRNQQDTFWSSEFVTDEKGPGQASPGDVEMVNLLSDYGYSCRLIADRLLGSGASEVAGVGDPAVFYVPANSNFVPLLVIMSGSGSSSDTPPLPTNCPVMVGEHVCLGSNSSKQGSIYMYAGTDSNDPNQGTGATKYMKVVAPNHPIMQGIPVDSEGRIKIFRDPYPGESAHVPPGGKLNYEYRWCTQNISNVAPCTTVLAVLAGNTQVDGTDRVCFAVADVGGLDAAGKHVQFRRVQIFMNEQGSGGPRRVFNALTVWGRMLFIRACQWAIGQALQPYQGINISECEGTGVISITNSIGMKLVQVPAGSFTMGYWQTAKLPSQILNVGQWFPDYGDYDEKPAHSVTISRSFYLGAYEVSNAEFERFDVGHHALRGKLGFSTNDSEAVVFVSWHEAKAFCDWLSAREGQPYRLPTEAEWEFACRAGTTTHFWTGDTLPSQYLKNPTNCWYPDPERRSPGDVVRLTVGQTTPNPWGLYDMHGNVEEWCQDWYGPYTAESQTDPVGRIDGLGKVTRGGSHSTFAFHLRSENRAGAVPEEKSWYIGFRVVLADLPSTAPLLATQPEGYQTNVSQTVPSDIETGPDPELPFFTGPGRYVNVPPNSTGPLYSSHNHDPSITQCANGDLLAIWYTTVSETGRELAMAASLLRY